MAGLGLLTDWNWKELELSPAEGKAKDTPKSRNRGDFDKNLLYHNSGMQ
jgi:hypothetical protein